MMIAPEIRHAWWHMDQEGFWEECIGPSCSGCEFAIAGPIRAYGTRLSEDDPWVIHASLVEAQRFMDKLIFRHATNMAYTVPEAIEYTNALLNACKESES